VRPTEAEAERKTPRIKAMNLIGYIAAALFALGWLGGIASAFYMGFQMLCAWFTADGWFGKREHGKKALLCGLSFFGFFAFLFCNGLIGTWFGGW
jgi:hypothetical protein